MKARASSTNIKPNQKKKPKLYVQSLYRYRSQAQAWIDHPSPRYGQKKGGVGRHVTANTPRYFTPNLQEKRIWVPELKRFVKVKLTARALKTINKNGAYATLKKAGII